MSSAHHERRRRSMSAGATLDLRHPVAFFRRLRLFADIRCISSVPPTAQRATPAPHPGPLVAVAGPSPHRCSWRTFRCCLGLRRPYAQQGCADFQQGSALLSSISSESGSIPHPPVGRFHKNIASTRIDAQGAMGGIDQTRWGGIFPGKRCRGAPTTTERKTPRG